MSTLSNPYAAWSLPDVMRLHSERLLDFLKRRGPFASEAAAAAFHEIMMRESAATRRPPVQIRRLYQIFWSSFVPPDYPHLEQRVPARDHKVVSRLSSRGLALLVPNIPTPKSFLDIGCGSGSITSALARHWTLTPENAVGVDIRRLGPTPDDIQFSQMRPDSLPRSISDRTFDLALASMVFHHARRAEKLLAQAARLLNPGGHLVIREHDAATGTMFQMLDTVHILMDQVFTRHSRPTPSARRYMGLSDWAGLAESSGLAQVGLTYKPYPADPSNPCGNFTLVVQKA